MRTTNLLPQFTEKPLVSGVFTNFESLVSKSYTCSLINTLLYR